jgi:hypothetical protein
VRAGNFRRNAGRTLRASTDHSGHDRIEDHIVHGMEIAAASAAQFDEDAS